MLRSIIITALVAGMHQTLVAQSNFLLQNEHRQEIKLSYGMEPNIAFRATYAHRLPGRLPLALFAGAETGFLQPISENFALYAGGRIVFLKKQAFSVSNELALTNGRLESKIYTATKWEISDVLAVSWNARITSVSLLAAYTHNLGMHLKHSDFYRETAYADAKDGWYGGFGGYWQTGLRVNQLLWRRLDMSLQLTYTKSLKGYGIGALPMYVQLGGAWRF